MVSQHLVVMPFDQEKDQESEDVVREVIEFSHKVLKHGEEPRANASLHGD